MLFNFKTWAIYLHSPPNYIKVLFIFLSFSIQKADRKEVILTESLNFFLISVSFALLTSTFETHEGSLGKSSVQNVVCKCIFFYITLKNPEKNVAGSWQTCRVCKVTQSPYANEFLLSSLFNISSLNIFIGNYLFWLLLPQLLLWVNWWKVYDRQRVCKVQEQK